MSAFHDSNLAHAARFLRQHLVRVVGISVLVLVPCFWLPHVGFGDFPSHVYNAWLAPQVERGELPGLTLAHLHTNVLTDYILERLITRVGANAAQRILLSASVLLMFWGMFAMVAAVSRRPPWWLMPIFAMLCYGYAFQLGFLNSYFSTAFCFLIFALLWTRPHIADLVAATVLLGAAVLAHPAGLAWLIGTLGFGWIVRASRPSLRWMWLAAGIMGLIAMNRFVVMKLSGVWLPLPWLNVMGADQFYLFRARFFWLAVAIALLWLYLLGRAVKESGWTLYATSPAAQMYLLNCAAVFLSPVAFKMSGGHEQSFGFLAGRLSLMTAVLACACIARVQPARWARALPALMALVFFWFLYTDIRQLNKVEARVDELLRSIPPGQRVMALIYYPRARISEQHHMLDRECIGRCWAYSDYEPSSGHFRIRAIGQNPYVMAVPKDVDEVIHGRYVARKDDLPLYQIYACGPRETDLCIRALQEGERNGAIDLLRHW